MLFTTLVTSQFFYPIYFHYFKPLELAAKTIIVFQYNCVWAHLCPCSIVCGDNLVRVQSNGHDHVWSKSCLVTVLLSCVGTNVCGQHTAQFNQNFTALPPIHLHLHATAEVSQCILAYCNTDIYLSHLFFNAQLNINCKE